MALSRTNRLTSSFTYNAGGTSSNTISSGSFTPGAGDLIVAFVYEFTNDATPSVTFSDTFGGTGTWNYVNVNDNDGANWYVSHVAYAIAGGSPSAGTVTCTRRAGNFSMGFGMDLVSISGADATTPIRQSATNTSAGASMAVSLPSACLSGSMAFSVVCVDDTAEPTVPSGYTDRISFAVIAGAVYARVVESLTSPSNTISWTGLGSYKASGVSIEVQAASASSFTGTLSKTQANTTVVGSGTLTNNFTGTLSKTQDATTVSSTGIYTASGAFSGFLARTAAASTVAGAGTVTNAYTGTLAKATGATTSAASGTTTNSYVGTLARTLASASGLPVGHGTYTPPASSAGYTILSAVPNGNPGHLVSSSGAGSNSGANLFNITYQQTGVSGSLVTSTAGVYVPTGTAPASGRPVIATCHGATGLGDSYAPGLGGWADFSTLISAGYVVVCVDGEGLGSAGRHPYSEGLSGTHGVVDAIRACAGLTTIRNQAAVFGFSIGGLTALQTAEYAGTYAPELNVVGVGFDPVVFPEYASDRWTYDDYVNGQVYGHWVANGLALSAIYSAGQVSYITGGGMDNDTFPTSLGVQPNVDPTVAGSGWSTAWRVSSPGFRKGNSSLIIDFGTFNGPAGWLTRATGQGTDATVRSRAGSHDISSAVNYHGEVLTWVGSKLLSTPASVTPPPPPPPPPTPTPTPTGTVDFPTFFDTKHPAGTASTIYIAATGSDGNAGTSQGAPKRTINAAINALPSGGGTVIALDSGSYAPTTVTRQFTGWCRVIAAVGFLPKITSTVVSGTTTSSLSFNNCTYVVFYGWELIGVGNASTDGEDNGLVANNRCHHIGIWKSKIHGHSGHGVAVTQYPNESGVGCNHINVCYNDVYDNQLYNPFAGSAISIFEMQDNLGGGDETDGVSNRLIGNLIYATKEVVGPHSDGNGIIFDYNAVVGYTGTSVAARNIVVNVGGGGIHSFNSSNVKKYFNTVLFVGRDTTAVQYPLNVYSSCFDDIASPGTITGYRTRYNIAANGTDPQVGSQGAPSWWQNSGGVGGENAVNNVILQTGPSPFVGTAGNTDRTAVGVVGYFTSYTFLTASSPASAIAGFLPKAATMVRYDLTGDTTVFNLLAGWPDYFGNLPPADKNWAAGALEPATTSTPTPITGTLAKTNANSTSTAAGTRTVPVFTGTLSKTQNPTTSAATGLYTAAGTFTGTLARTTASSTLAAAGTHSPPVGSSGGTLASVLANSSGAGVGVFTQSTGRTGTWLFRTPTRPGWRAQQWPWLRWAGSRVGIAVLKLNGVYVQRLIVTRDEMARATEVYLGGHDNIVTGPIADALFAAGYTLTQVSP